MRIVDDPVEDGVGDGGFSDHLMPSRDRKLGGDDCGSALVALFEEFEQIKALLIGEGMGAPVVEHQELDAGEFVDETRESTIESGHAHILEQAGHAHVGYRVVQSRSLMPEGAGQPRFAGSGQSGDDDLFMSLEPSALGKREDLAPIQSPVCREVDILDARVA